MAQFLSRCGSYLIHKKYISPTIFVRFNSSVQFQPKFKRAVIVGLFENNENNSSEATFASNRGEHFCTNELNVIEKITRC